MKRSIVLTALFATALFAKTELSLNLGTNSFAGDEELDSATSLGIRGDFYLDNLYHIDLGYDNLGDVNIKNSTKKLKIDRIYTQFSADGEEEYHVVPTMSVGVGYENQKGDLSDSQPFVSAGVNFRYNISNSFNFLLGTKALWKTSSRDVNFHTTFGVGMMLGNEPVNNEEQIQNVQIPEQKLDISTQFSPSEVSQLTTPPTEVDLAKDSKEIVVSSSDDIVTPPQNTPVISNQIVQQPVSMQTSPTVVKTTGYYIQVAAYSKNQPTSLLTKLSKRGNHVILRHNGSITKALVGPFDSDSQARRALKKVKRVAKGAFIYKG